MQKRDILSLSFSELCDVLVELGEKKFRAEQIFQWVWQKRVRSFDEMSNLSQQLRNSLSERFFFQTVKVAKPQKSSDGSCKVAFSLHDGAVVEGVLIPAKDRMTACISTQVGCGMHCSFCATATMGFIRNLSCGEITDQFFVLDNIARENGGTGISNIVYMGMGEPLMNYSAVMDSIARLTDKKGVGLAPSRITLSTSGIVSQIKKLADDGFPCNLAVSLHAPKDMLRTQLMPVNKTNPLAKLSDALAYYHEKTGARITIEYMLLNGINDSVQHARDLAEFTKRFPVKINVIEFNPHPASAYKKSDKQTLDAFVNFLKGLNLVVNVRYSKGRDIAAACGQLASKIKKGK
ncbi:MAG: 23S rRNA (adenine(2503)-C(2))-methyltransferase RlmN [Bacteroidales bacterium]|nr:23S rRNA (adenine(2503)-C(2))-methyltransferase RlmN [Bacteroidales bacterium]